MAGETKKRTSIYEIKVTFQAHSVKTLEHLFFCLFVFLSFFSFLFLPSFFSFFLSIFFLGGGGGGGGCEVGCGLEEVVGVKVGYLGWVLRGFSTWSFHNWLKLELLEELGSVIIAIPRTRVTRVFSCVLTNLGYISWECFRQMGNSKIWVSFNPSFNLPVLPVHLALSHFPLLFYWILTSHIQISTATGRILYFTWFNSVQMDHWSEATFLMKFSLLRS